MEDLKRLLATHPFFKDMKEAYIEFLAGCGKNVRFEPGEFIFRNGEPAEKFYIVRHGAISLEIFVPGRGAVMIETIREGNVMGWSWLVPPYRWHFDARALELTRAIEMDGKCVREKCDSDPALGYTLMLRIAEIMQERLKATQLQLIDVYRKD